jgi:TetR/AcrR family transcriptional regulator
MVKPNGQSIQSGSEAGTSTRERIKAAASREFIDKGLDGARMQAIAERAGANKAMIYYYFHSKEELYSAIIRDAFAELFRLFENIGPMDSIDAKDLITQVVHFHFQFFAENPHIPVLLAREMHGKAGIASGVFREVFEKVQSRTMPGVLDCLVRARKTGAIRRVDPVQTVWNIVAMNIFYFIAKPVLGILWPDLGADEERLIDRREKAVVDLVLHGLLPRD